MSRALALPPKPETPPSGPRIAVFHLGGDPLVLQLLPGETQEDALHRHDRACAEKARADGLGMFLCNRCDRPIYVCRRDPATCARRAARATPKITSP